MTKKRLRPKTLPRRAAKKPTRPEARSVRNPFSSNHCRMTAQSDQISAQRGQIAAQGAQIDMQNERLRQSETDLEEALFRYADLYDLAPIGYLTITRRGVIRQVNLAAAALLEGEGPAVVGVPLVNFVAGGQRRAFRRFLSEAAHSPVASSIEVRLATSASHLVRVVARMVRGRRVSHEVLAAMLDITEERLLDAERSATLERERRRGEELAREAAIRTRTEARVTALLERLVSVQEEERRRIARNLHDHLGQQMTALRLSVGALKDDTLSPADLRLRLEGIDKIASQIDRDVDFLAWELRPAALDDVGLSAALETIVRDWSAANGVDAEFHGSPEAARLAGESESHLYRIVQEALNNVSKHAAATHVSVLLEHQDREVRVIIEDDGRGFDAEQAAAGLTHRGLGLTSMQERAALIGGHVEFESAPGRGTTVFARVPIRATTPSRG